MATVEQYLFWSFQLAIWTISTIIIAVMVIKERNKRKELRIVRFQRNAVQVVQQGSVTPSADQRNRNSVLYVEVSLHYLSYLVYGFGVFTALFAVISRLYIVYQYLSIPAICRIVTITQNISFVLHKIFVVFFQLKRYQICFKGTKSLQMYYKIVETALILMILVAIISPIFLTNNTVWNDMACHFDVTIYYMLSTGLPYFMLDISLLSIFINKVLKMSKQLNKQKQSLEQQKNLKSVINVTLVNSKLFYILKRIVILSLVMEMATLLSTINLIFNGVPGRVVTATTSLFLALDVIANVKCISLMFEHNTRDYERLLELFKCCNDENGHGQTMQQNPSNLDDKNNGIYVAGTQPKQRIMTVWHLQP